MKGKLLFIIFILTAFTVYAQLQTMPAPKLTVSKRGAEIASFNGTGSQTTKSFQLKSGPATFSVLLNWEKSDAELQQGEGKFSVVLQDEQGKTIEQVIGTFDHFDGARTVDIATAGNYKLQITAPGNWSVEVEQ